jgi:hypothetical protein
VAAIATPHTNLILNVRQPLSHAHLWNRVGEWFEDATLIALTGVAVIALSIPMALVVVSIVNVLSAVIDRMW